MTRKAREAFARKSATHTETVVQRFIVSYELLVEAVSEAQVQGRDVDEDKFGKLLDEFETIGEEADMDMMEMLHQAELSEQINTRSARLRRLMETNGNKVLTLPRRIVTGTEVTTEGASRTENDDEDDLIEDNY